MRWFRPRCPVDAATKTWVEQRMDWLAQTFGPDRMLTAPLVLPTAEFFPQSFDGSRRAGREVFELVCGWMELEPGRFELEFDKKTDDPDPAVGAYYANDREVVSIKATELQDPQWLVGTMAHELAHALLLGDGRMDNDVSDHEHVTDLLTVFMGLGILSSNSRLRTTQWRHRMDWERVIQAFGYMDHESFGYALALFAWARGDHSARWAKHLRPDVRSPLRCGLRYLLKTDDSLFRPRDGRRTESLVGPAALAADLRSPHAGVRVAAVWAARRGASSPKDTAPLLVQALQDEDRCVCEEAAFSLGLFGAAAQQAAVALVANLEHSDWRVRQSAAWALGQIGVADESVVDALIGLRDDREESVQLAGVAALGNLGPAAAVCVDYLIEVLSERSVQLRSAAISALAAVGKTAARAVEPLAMVMEDEHGEVRAAALAALAAVGEPATAVPFLARSLDDPDYEVSFQALRSLASLELPAAEDVLQTQLHHPEPQHRVLAAAALLKKESCAEQALATLSESIWFADSAEGPSHDGGDSVWASEIADVEWIPHTGPAAVAPLAGLLDSLAAQDRRLACWGLLQLAEHAGSCIAQLELRLNDKDSAARLLAACGLWRAGGGVERSAACLLKLIHESAPAAAHQRCCELLRPYDVESNRLPPLAADPDPGRNICGAASLALQAIGRDAVPVILAELERADETACGLLARTLAVVAAECEESRHLLHQARVRSPWRIQPWLTKIEPLYKRLAEIHGSRLRQVTIPAQPPRNDQPSREESLLAQAIQALGEGNTSTTR